MSNFDEAFRLVIGHEGGFTNDRADRGNWTSGKVGVGTLKGTKYGISAMSYPSEDIRNLTLGAAKAIYKRDFWDKNHCDKLPSGLAYLHFDASINHGGGRSARFLQASVGAVVDGAIGPKTLGLANKVDQTKAISEFCVVRGLFYTDIGTFQRYKKGWFRRLFDTHTTALRMAGSLDQSNEDPAPDHVCAIKDENPDDEAERYFWMVLTQDLQRLAERATEGPLAKS